MMLQKNIEKLGHVRTVILIVACTIVSALLLYVLISFLLGAPLTSDGFLTALIIPIIIAPIISWYIVKLLFKIMKLESEMRSLATKDYLTNLFNRKFFLDSALHIYRLAIRNKLNFTILYIDVDNFKSINDTYGHTVGDKVLASFGRILQINKRESDLAGRIGGEEFLYALADTSLDGAVLFAEKIRKLVEKDVIEIDGLYINNTISIGISVYSENNKVTLDKLISQADRALYEAKSAGKNCVKVYKK